MASIFDKFPFSSYEGLNLDWVLQNLKQLFGEGEALYQDLREWKEDTTTEVQTWISNTNEALAAWKTQTESDFTIQITSELNSAKQELLDTVAAGLLAIEGIAYGTQNGEPVTEDSPYYHNNCTWYKEQAAASAMESRAWANGQNASPLYANNNSKYFRERSEAWAVGQINGTDVPDTDDTYENNAKYYSDLVGAAAAQIETNTGDIADLKSATNNLESAILRTNIILRASGMQTGRWLENGTYDNWSKSQCSTEYILTAFEKLLLKASTSTQYRYIQLVEFDENNTVVSIHGGYNPNASIPTTKTVKVTVPKGHKIKINIGYWSDSDAATYITDDYLSANYTIEYGYIPSVDTSLTIAGNAADAKATGDAIATSNVIYADKESLHFTWISGKYKTTNGAWGADSTCLCSEYQVPFLGYLKFSVPAGFKIQWLHYTDWNYASFDKYSNWITDNIYLLNDGYYKFNLAYVSGGSISINDAPNIVTEIGLNANIPNANSIYLNTQIKAILSCYNTLKFSSGIYNISNASTLILKDNQKIIGSGFSTILRFADNVNGAAITCAHQNIISDIQIKGRDEDYVVDNPGEGQEAVPSVMGTRHGILISSGIRKGIINNVWIHGFDGYGVYADNNGTASNQGFCISNCYFTSNHGGMFLRKSEFYKITNCDFVGNYKGLFLGGGNNTVDACNISSNHYGINMDNSDGLSTNNTHGSVTGCIIQHSRIAAVYINNMVSGEIFSACNIDPNDNTGYAVQAVSAHRIIFTGCNFMEYSTISITDGGLIMFIGCNMRDFTSSHYTSNNNKVKFINCYNDSGTLINPTGT